MKNFLLAVLFAATSMFAATNGQLQQQVKSLDLGLGGYKIGYELSDKQLENLQNYRVEASMPNTTKFQKNGYNVIIDDASKTVLVVYKDFEKAAKKQLESSIGNLMLTFQEPTTMTHNKVLYWFYQDNGKMNKEDLETLKNAKKGKKATLAEKIKNGLLENKDEVIASLEPIASVKLSSDQEIKEKACTQQKNKEDSEQTDAKEDKKFDYYIIVSSEKLLKHYFPNI